MARIMRRATTTSTAINAIWTALSCPAGKKYEVIGVWVNIGATANRIVAAGVLDGADFHQAFGATVPAAFGIAALNYTAVVVEAGEDFIVQTGGAGASAWSGMVTYIDVDV